MKLRVVLALAVACLVATNSHSQLQLGPAQNEQAGRDAAKRQLSQVLERDPNNREALFGLGRLMADEGDLAPARSLFARYVVISPTEPAAWAYLMRCAVGEDDPKGAAMHSAKLRTWHLPTLVYTRKRLAGWPAPHFER